MQNYTKIHNGIQNTSFFLQQKIQEHIALGLFSARAILDKNLALCGTNYVRF